MDWKREKEEQRRRKREKERQKDCEEKEIRDFKSVFVDVVCFVLYLNIEFT